MEAEERERKEKAMEEERSRREEQDRLWRLEREQKVGDSSVHSQLSFSS